MAGPDESKTIKRLLLEMKAENVALKCLIPPMLSQLALTSDDDDPNDWLRRFHDTAVVLVDHHLQHMPDSEMRARAVQVVDELVTAVQLRKVED